MGLANGYGQVIVSMAFLFSSSGLMTIAKSVDDAGLIYYWMGGLIIFIAFFLFFGIKDVIVGDVPKNS
jgi:hypothetical protein